jgi:acetylglutamate kinase
MHSTQDVIVKLLTNIGSRKEVEQYLRHYASVDGQKLAVVNVGASVLEEARESLASSLSFLQNVGLHPIVVAGAGLELGKALADAIDDYGTRACLVTSGVFRARQGSAGAEIAMVNAAALKSSVATGVLPILLPQGEDAAGHSIRIHPDVVTRELALAVQSHKIIFLTGAGGVLDGEREVVSAVNLDADLDDLLQRDWMNEATRFQLSQIDALLRKLPRSSSVSITSPEHLAKELFTHRGAGTLVRLGERIDRYEDFASVDVARVRGLLEVCFARELDPDYFAKKSPLAVYLADSYRATAIVTREEPMPYLDKFAVTTEAQGEGIGGLIWKRLRREVPRFFWRSRPTNPVNEWYAEKADGSYKTATWSVFWCGTGSFPEIQACVERALAMPASLRDRRTSEVPRA